LSNRELLELLRYTPSGEHPCPAKARVFARLERTIAGLSPAENVLRPRGAGIQRATTRVAAVAGIAFVLGGATGAAVHASLQHPRAERVVYRERVIAAPATSALASSPASTAEPELPPPVASAPRSTVVLHREPAAQDLAAERALLDRARRALGGGNYDEADEVLDGHARRFPGGVLAEEREALAIKVLASSGRAIEARTRAEGFRERFPSSLFGPSVDETLSTIP